MILQVQDRQRDPYGENKYGGMLAQQHQRYHQCE
jgi:hypothetical protein